MSRLLWPLVVTAPLLLVALACSPPKATKPTPAPSPRPLVSVGSAACQPCHSDIAAAHSKTRHAATLFPATRTALGALTPPQGSIRKGMDFIYQGDTLAVAGVSPKTKQRKALPLDLVLGSGKTGMTYLIAQADSTIEISRSYFPKQKAWLITPSQELLDDTHLGAPHRESSTRKCLSCHAVTGPEQPMIPEKKFFGVGCESCHGPGSAHVEAMHQGQKLALGPIESLRNLSGEKVNALCGRCHRTVEEARQMGELALKATQRFQPYGLSLSKCFTQSAGKLTCVTCHNPHTDASKDQRAYEKTCLSCHDGSAKAKPLCPVNPKAKCVSCHMPLRDVFDGEPKLPIAMADHFIRKRTPKN